MKTKQQPFRLDTARRTTTVRCRCMADPCLFLPWEALSAAAKKEFHKNGGIPCEGGGLPGEWCAGCRFGVVDEPEDE